MRGRGTASRSPTRNRAWACGDRTARRRPARRRRSGRRRTARRRSTFGDAVGAGRSGRRPPTGRRRFGPRGRARVGPGADRPRPPRRSSSSPVHRQSTPPRPSRTSARRRRSACGRGGRRRPSASPACTRRTARRRRRGTRPGAATACHPAAGEPLDRRRLAGRPTWPDGHEAGADLLAVEPDRARAAVARVAAHLRAGQPEVLAQDVDEAPPAVGPDASTAWPLTANRSTGDAAGRPHAATARDRAPDERERRVAPVVGGARGRRRSATSPARCPAPARRRAASPAGRPRAPPRAPRSRARDRRAGPDGDPGVGHDRRRATTSDRGHRDDRDHEVGPRAELRERRPREPALRRCASARRQARDELVGPEVGRPVAEHERRRPARSARHAPRRRARRVASSASRFGSPVGGRRGVDDVARTPSRAFWIWRPPIVARRRPQPVEHRRQRRASARSVQVVSRRDPPAAVVGRRSRAARRARVMSRTGRSIGRRRMRGVDVGAAGDDQPRLAPARIASASSSRRGGRTAGRTLTPAATVRPPPAAGRRVARTLEVRRIPVERVEDQVVDAAQRLDLAPDPLGDLLGLAEQVELLPVVEVHARVDAEQRRRRPRGARRA